MGGTAGKPAPSPGSAGRGKCVPPPWRNAGDGKGANRTRGTSVKWNKSYPVGLKPAMVKASGQEAHTALPTDLASQSRDAAFANAQRQKCRRPAVVWHDPCVRGG